MFWNNNAACKVQHDNTEGDGMIKFPEHGVCLNDDLFNLVYPLEDWNSFDFAQAMEAGRSTRYGTNKKHDIANRLPRGFHEGSYFCRRGSDNFTTEQLRRAWRTRFKSSRLRAA